jgi:hypothetical protein
MSAGSDPWFLWLHIKKAAGQSVREALSDVYVQTDRSLATPFVALPKKEWNDNLNNYRVPLGRYDYRRLLFAKRFLFSEQFDQMFKFCVVRNPYSRALSSFLYDLRHGGVGNKRRRIRLVRLFPRPMFRSYLEALPTAWVNTSPRHRALHSAPVIPDITDENGKFLTDFVAKLESIEADIGQICDALGISHRPFPRIHASRGRIDKEAFYDSRNRRLVERLYAEDIDLLEYSFPW